MSNLYSTPTAKNSMKLDHRIPRERMVKQQLIPRGIHNAEVLEAMTKVHRHLFVPEAFHATAYEDRPLPIGMGQTISQPYVVAHMCQLLMASPGMSVLEVGTGSGYQAAILQAMGLSVFTVERIDMLYKQARSLIHNQLGMLTVRMQLSDGTLGWSEMAPFDRIIVAAGGPEVPEELKNQLTDGGIMVIPVGKEKQKQEVIRVTKYNDRFIEERCGAVSFVDLIGEGAW